MYLYYYKVWSMHKSFVVLILFKAFDPRIKSKHRNYHKKYLSKEKIRMLFLEQIHIIIIINYYHHNL